MEHTEPIQMLCALNTDKDNGDQCGRTKRKELSDCRDVVEVLEEMLGQTSVEVIRDSLINCYRLCAVMRINNNSENDFSSCLRIGATHSVLRNSIKVTGWKRKDRQRRQRIQQEEMATEPSETSETPGSLQFSEGSQTSEASQSVSENIRDELPDDKKLYIVNDFNYIEEIGCITPDECNKIEELFSAVNQLDHTKFSLFCKDQFNDVYNTCGFVTPISKEKKSRFFRFRNPCGSGDKSETKCMKLQKVYMSIQINNYDLSSKKSASRVFINENDEFYKIGCQRVYESVLLLTRMRRSIKFMLSESSEEELNPFFDLDTLAKLTI
ncbi:unnamed protein product [Moneuplotes crassus]|uniref:Uncharacterized protein n=1 Tax=Euplotes crassus TaxID=5936 RepID=A0AAD1U8Y9_EUPCR|nr:unnamed protein product [Moneuplotes crassus]